MKKHSIVLIFLVALILLLCGCGRGKVGERQIKEDLNNRFSMQQFIVDDVKIDLAKHEKNMSLYDVTVKMTTPNAMTERMYRVLYNYYDVGGWIMEDMFEINIENWKAEPTKFDVSNEKIAEMVFTKDTDRNGFFISKEIIPNVKFNEWTQDVYGEWSAEDYIDQVLHNDIKDGNTMINVQCYAKSSKWRIAEEFLLCWSFNKKELKWEFISGESINSDIEFFDGIEGKYFSNISYNEQERAEIKIVDGNLFLFNNTPDGWIAGVKTDKAKIEITGLFNGRIYDSDDIRCNIDFIIKGNENLKISISSGWVSRLFEKE